MALPSVSKELNQYWVFIITVIIIDHNYFLEWEQVPISIVYMTIKSY